MSAFRQAAADYYAEVHRRAAEYVESGMEPHDAYLRAKRRVEDVRSRKTQTLREFVQTLREAP